MTTANDVLMSDRCCQCGIAFAIPETLKQLRLSDGQWFYCPNGHAQRYTSSTGDKLRDMTSERDHWQKEAERLLEECDRLRANRPAKRAWWERWSRKSRSGVLSHG